MRVNYFGVLITLIMVASCNYIDCNYEKLSEKEYEKITELNRNAIRIDTMYNDKCLKRFFHVYLKTKSSDSELENEVESIFKMLKSENMERDVWVFNNQKVFLYRLFYDNSQNNLMKSDLQYPNE